MVLLACLLIVVVGCGTELEPLRATTVTVTPGAATLTSVGQSAAFTATVTDQHGSVFAGTVMWTSDAPNVFTVDPAGVATAVSNGTGTIRAQVDGVSGTATVTISQRPTAVERVGGDGQRGRPGMPLVEPLVARILDAGGSPVAGTAVFFSPADGSGFVTPGTAPTDMAGEARASWTLGDDFGHQSLVASVADGANTVFSATAQRPDELADSVEIVSGDGQAARPGKGLRQPIVVRVLDEHDAPVEGATVVFEAPRGHGFADPDSVRSDRDGEAATTWTLGEKLGLQLLTASVPGGPGTRVTATATEGVCGRTPQVRDALMKAVGVTECNDATIDMLAQIEKLTLGDRRITSLKAGDFADLPGLQDLDLQGNPLTTLPPGVFEGLSSLRELNLQNNELAHLPVDVFRGLPSLVVLHLGGNLLTDLPRSVFSGLPSLEGLDLRRNLLAELAAGVFAGTPDLVGLNLSENRLAEWQPEALSGLPSLRELDLGGNRLAKLPAGAFAGLPGLVALNLQGNRLAKLPMGVFGGLSSLEHLHLGGNRLAELSQGLFSGLSSLRQLGIENNELVRLPAGVFGSLSSLKTLDLHGNLLAELAAGVFAGLSDIEELGLAGNRVVQLAGSVFSGSSGLIRLYLRENLLSQLPAGVFHGLPDLAVLDLRENQLAELPHGVFRDLSRLERLDLGRNRLAELPPRTLAGLSSLRRLWLWGNELTGLPKDIFSDVEKVEEVWLSYNQLTALPKDIFSGLNSLEVVDASHNHLSTLPPSILSGLGQLRWLWLHENDGSPFPFVLQMERIDTADLEAPGPATLAVTVDEGAPFAMQVTLSASGATISPSTVTIPTGATQSSMTTVTTNTGQGIVTVTLGPAPEIPNTFCYYNYPPWFCYKGVVIEVGDSIELFK